MIVVTGATGQLGSLVVEELLKLAPPGGIGVSVRDPSKASRLANRGVRVRHGDFTRPETLADAFQGATQILMVSSNAAAYGGDTKAQHRSAIDAARAAGAERVVYTSHMGVSATSAFPPMHDHAATEAMLRESGLTWTALRNGFYAESAPLYFGDALSSGVLKAPGDGKVSWAAHTDLAAAAARVLMNPGQFNGPTPPLVGAEALDFADMARLLSDLTGTSISRQVVSDEDTVAGLTASKMPPAVVQIVIGFYRAARAGEFIAQDSTLAELIQRQTASMREVLAATAL